MVATSEPKYRVVIRTEMTIEAFDEGAVRELMALAPENGAIEAYPPALPEPIPGKRGRRRRELPFYFALLALLALIGLMLGA